MANPFWPVVGAWRHLFDVCGLLIDKMVHQCQENIENNLWFYCRNGPKPDFMSRRDRCTNQNLNGFAVVGRANRVLLWFLFAFAYERRLKGPVVLSNKVVK